MGHEVTLVNPRYRVKELKFSTIPFRRYDEYDVIHLHGPTPFLSDLTLLTNSKFKIIYTHHAEVSWLSERLSKIYRNFHRLLAKRARAVIVHSYDYALLFMGPNVTVIRMPCPLKPPNNLNLEQKSASFTVLYVGQFRPFKGIEVLIEAASKLKNVDFVLVGDGYLKPKLTDMARHLRNVKFAGAVCDDELLRLYGSAHVICLPSVNTTEGYGLVLIEGALYGCVPLASNLIGVRENVFQLEGILFKPNSYESLTEKIRMLSNDKELWINLAKRSYNAACDYVKTYSSDFYVGRHEEIFRELS